MATKISNQISFVEHNKISEIQEWYLASSQKTGVEFDSSTWSQTVPSLNSTNKYLWNCEVIKYSLDEDDISTPAIIGVYGDSTIALLTNENITLSANSKGEVSATTFRTEVVAYSGTESTRVMLGNILGAPPGVSVNILYNNNTCTVVFTVEDKATLGSIDSCHGTIKIQVTSPIRVDLNLSWSKINSGENAKYIKLNTTHHVVKVDKNGDFSPETITITPTVNDTDKENLIWYFSKNGGKSFYARLSGLGITVWKYDQETDGYVEVPNHEELTQDHRSYVTIDCSTFKNNTSVDSIVVGLRNKNDTFKDLMTIYKTSDGADGADGASAYTLFLTNENVTFNTDSNGIVTEEITFSTNVAAYLGDTQVAVETDMPVSSDPDVMVYSPTNDGDEIHLGFTIAKGVHLDVGGEIEIPVTKPIPATLILSWSTVRDGAQAPRNIALSTTSHIIKVDKDGNVTPSTITVTPTISTPDVNDVFTWDFSTDGGGWQDSKTGVTISKDNPNESISIENQSHITINTASLSLNRTLAIRFRTPDNVSNYYEDVLTIHKVSDGSNGSDGRGIKNVINYYQITSDTIAPDTNSDDWSTTAPTLTPTDRFLWNYEVIEYTEGQPTKTAPAIIGVYGDSGENMVTFEIYAPKGLVFNKDVDSIELKVAAFQGSTKIEGAVYKWAWWNPDLNDGSGGYSIIIENTNDSVLVVNKTDQYATSSLRCSMIYDGHEYEDYISLINETTIYTSDVKFFNGSNIFYADDLYLVAYVELYQNGLPIETIATTKYCTGISHLAGETIIADIPDGNDGDKMYFVYQDGDMYNVVLGQFSSTTGLWKKINNSTNYTYTNDLYPNIESNVIAISKEKIDKSRNVNFTILQNGTPISGTSTNVIDSNDPIISSSAPTNPVYNQLWLDTSTTPYILKIYTQTDSDSGRWVDCSEKIGGAVFTSKPASYHVGDLWILAEGESCGNFGPGSMLRATRDSSNCPMIAYLTKENVVIAADSSGYAQPTTFTTDVIVCSATNTADNIMLGALSGLPRGVTAKTTSGVNGKKTITFSLASSNTLGSTDNCSGTINIPITSPIETTLKLSWSKVNGLYDTTSGAQGNVALSTSSYTMSIDDKGLISPSTIKITPTIKTVSSDDRFIWDFQKNTGTFSSGTVISGVTRYPSGTGAFYASAGPYVTIDTNLLNTPSVLNTFSVKLRTNNITSEKYAYSDTITIHTLSHTNMFKESDWVDADVETTQLKKDIQQYFSFDSVTGLTIGQTNKEFYVNITGKKMSFYDNQHGQHQEVVVISNESATIRDLTVEVGATFKCNTTFEESVKMFDFLWQQEADGSLSLVAVV